MYREQIHVVTNVLLVVDGMVVIAAGYGAWYICGELSGGEFAMAQSLFVALVMSVMLLNNFVLGRMGLYGTRFAAGAVESIGKISLAVFFEFAVVTLGLFLLGSEMVTRAFLVSFSALVYGGLLAVRMVSTNMLRERLRSSSQVQRVLLVGSRDRVDAVREALEQVKGWGHRMVGWLSLEPETDIGELECLGGIGCFEDILGREELDEVIFALPPDAPIKLRRKVELCRTLGVTARIVPGMFDPEEDVRGLTVERLGHVPTLTVLGSQISASGLFYKRIVDILGGLVGCVLLALMFPFVALAIRLDSPGPILFRQIRVGRNNRHFRLYKFRTMYVDAEARKQELLCHNEMNGCMFKMENDPRITRVGRFLRVTSLDEFPQFLNVLKGEMSLVGTRPPTIDEVERYEPWQRRRLSMKPGITGLWQVSGRNQIKDFEKVVELDLEYIDEWRFMKDMQILLQTVLVVLKRKGVS